MPEGEEHIQRIVPNGLTELTFYLNSRPKSMDTRKNITENTILSGHLKSYYDISVTGNLSMFSVSFRPFGVRMFLNIPANELYDINVPLRYLISDMADRLEDQLLEAGCFSEKVAIIESFLAFRLAGSIAAYDLKRIENSVNLITSAKGAIQVDNLSDAACLSRKQFERIFTNYIGTSPKQFLKTVRFQSSLQIKHLNPEMPLTELAYSCGYYDQSHMINDFRSLSGKTPGQYFAECDPFSDFFSE